MFMTTVILQGMILKQKALSIFLALFTGTPMEHLPALFGKQNVFS